MGLGGHIQIDSSGHLIIINGHIQTEPSTPAATDPDVRVYDIDMDPNFSGDFYKDGMYGGKNKYVRDTGGATVWWSDYWGVWNLSENAGDDYYTVPVFLQQLFSDTPPRSPDGRFLTYYNGSGSCAVGERKFITGNGVPAVQGLYKLEPTSYNDCPVWKRSDGAYYMFYYNRSTALEPTINTSLGSRTNPYWYTTHLYSGFASQVNTYGERLYQFSGTGSGSIQVGPMVDYANIMEVASMSPDVSGGYHEGIVYNSKISYDRVAADAAIWFDTDWQQWVVTPARGSGKYDEMFYRVCGETGDDELDASGEYYGYYGWSGEAVVGVTKKIVSSDGIFDGIYVLNGYMSQSDRYQPKWISLDGVYTLWYDYAVAPTGKWRLSTTASHANANYFQADSSGVWPNLSYTGAGGYAGKTLTVSNTGV